VISREPCSGAPTSPAPISATSISPMQPSPTRRSSTSRSMRSSTACSSTASTSPPTSTNTEIRALALSEGQLRQPVANEWSFVETVRHLVFAMDKWFTAAVLGGRFAPIGLPNTSSVDFPWPDLDLSLDPAASDALAVRRDRVARFREFLTTITPGDLQRSVAVLENGTNSVEACIQVVFEEEFWHMRYARRDLEQLNQRSADD
jgi:hypothetical protein